MFLFSILLARIKTNGWLAVNSPGGGGMLISITCKPKNDEKIVEFYEIALKNTKLYVVTKQ